MFTIERMQADDWPEVAHLIYASTNAWYQKNRDCSIFQCDPQELRIFCQIYESLDPGCCLIARCCQTQTILGSCFFHPRSSHVSLGIMNVHPQEFGKGIARSLLREICEIAEQSGLPVRLVSSAMNLDSFSLYTRAGFIPRQLYQDFQIAIPAGGMSVIDPSYQCHQMIRHATMGDVLPMGQLEQRISGIRRDQDYTHFIKNELGVWHCTVMESDSGLKGWIASIQHPASSMVGPCVAEDEPTAIELLKSEIDYRRGASFVFLVPADCEALVKAAYGLKARNCELHVLQVRGAHQPFKGVSLPTFLPETA